MYAEVDIYNLALDALGNTTQLANTTDNTPAARACRRHYELARDAVLKDFPWPFAVRAVALAVVGGATFPGYEYVYRYPSDCLQARQVTDADGRRLRWYACAPGQQFVQWLPPKIPYQVSSDATGKLILTDLKDAYLIYTARVESTAVYDALFVDALSRRLAYALTVPLAVDAKKAQAVWATYRAALTSAHAAHLNELQPDPRPESPSISARY